MANFVTNWFITAITIKKASYMFLSIFNNLFITISCKINFCNILFTSIMLFSCSGTIFNCYFFTIFTSLAMGKNRFNYLYSLYSLFLKYLKLNYNQRASESVRAVLNTQVFSCSNPVHSCSALLQI